jgi:hypothetical protein
MLCQRDVNGPPPELAVLTSDRQSGSAVFTLDSEPNNGLEQERALSPLR